MFVYSVERSVTLCGECHKQFVCERCDTGFGYLHCRRVVVKEHFFSFSLTERSAFAKLRIRAESKLARALANELDPVPCPVCGWVQSSMIEYRRKHELHWMKTFAVISLLSGIALGAMLVGIGIYDRVQDEGYFWFAGTVANFGIFVALASWGLRRIVLRYTDPNRRFTRAHFDDDRSPPPLP